MFIAMTYNVANGLARPDDLAAALLLSRADVIGLEELAADQAIAIERSLIEHYPHQVLHPLGIPGKGLISRFPIVGAELVEFYPARPDLVVELCTPDGAIRVIVAHPPPPRFRRSGFHFDGPTRAQIESLADLATAGGSTILMGDFNAPERHRSLRRLNSAGLTDAFRAAGEGGGLTLPLPPMLRVDYIWHTTDLTTLAAWVGDNAGSDHLPVLARLAFSRSDP